MSSYILEANGFKERDGKKNYYEMAGREVELDPDDIVRLAEFKRLLIGYAVTAFGAWAWENGHKDASCRDFADYVSDIYNENCDRAMLQEATNRGYTQELT